MQQYPNGPTPNPPPQWAPGGQQPAQRKTPLILLLSAIGAVVLVVLVVGALNLASAIRAGSSSAESPIVPTAGASGGSGSAGSTSDSGGSGYPGASDEPGSAELSLSVGDCIHMIDPSRTTPNYRPALCGSEKSDFVVAGMLRDTQPKCPNMSYVQFTVPSGGGYCLRMDVRKGDCVDHGGPERVRTKVPCSAGSATGVITTADSSGADKALCAPGSKRYILYPEPGITVCWKRFAGA